MKENGAATNDRFYLYILIISFEWMDIVLSPSYGIECEKPMAVLIFIWCIQYLHN